MHVYKLSLPILCIVTIYLPIAQATNKKELENALIAVGTVLTAALAVTVAVSISKHNNRKREAQNLNTELEKYKTLSSSLIGSDPAEKSLAHATKDTIALTNTYAKAVQDFDKVSSTYATWREEQQKRLTQLNSKLESLHKDLDKDLKANPEKAMVPMSEEDYNKFNSQVESLKTDVSAVKVANEYGTFRANVQKDIDTLKQYQASTSDPTQKGKLDENIKKATELYETTQEQYNEGKEKVNKKWGETQENAKNIELVIKGSNAPQRQEQGKSSSDELKGTGGDFKKAEQQSVATKSQEQLRSLQALETSVDNLPESDQKESMKKSFNDLKTAYSKAYDAFKNDDMKAAAASQQTAQNMLDEMHKQLQVITSQQVEQVKTSFAGATNNLQSEVSNKPTTPLIDFKKQVAPVPQTNKATGTNPFRPSLAGGFK